MADAARVRIHYRRPPDRIDLFVQPLVQRSADCIITFMPRTPLPRPVRVHDRIVLEDGGPVIWFTWPDRMHDVGCFHDLHGRCTGHYANIITPVQFRSPTEWETTDLFLDVWVGADGTVALLDEDELAAAVAAGAVGQDVAALARAEADRLLAAARIGDFPPAEVRAWTLERVRAMPGTDAGAAG